MGTLCRMEDWDEIVYFAEEQVDWLRRFLPFANGIASAKTFRTVFRALDHGAFSETFTAWVSEWGGRGVIAIDGKTLRGSKDGESGPARHVLNAFAHESGLVLGHQPVDGKSNEITAIPAFLERLALEGAIVTMDAMGAQKDLSPGASSRRKRIHWTLPIRLSPTPTICSVSPWTAGKGRRRRIEEAIRLILDCSENRTGV